METIISIINGAEQGNFIDGMIFMSAAVVLIGAVLGTFCWVGEKIINHTNLGSKLANFLEDE